MKHSWKAAAFGVLAVLFVSPESSAQQLASARVVTACGATAPFPTPHVGSTFSLTVDNTGTLCAAGGGGGGGNASVGPNGSAVPADSTQIGFSNSSGNLTNVSASNPLPTTGAFTWPGTAGNATQGTNPGSGTMPYVNSVNKTAPYTSGGASSGQYAVSLASVTTLTVPSGALVAEICVESSTARYTDDGATPSATIGIPVTAGTCFQYAGPLSAFKIIGTGATLDVSYYK